MSKQKTSQSAAAQGVSRRSFLRTTATTAVAAGLPASVGIAKDRNANSRLGVGFIGTGGRGGAHLGTVDWLRKDGGEAVDIVALCDTYGPRLRAKAEDCGAKQYRDYRELLADPAVDVVCIATPDHHHAIQTIDAVRAGKDVYCEKPISHWRQFEITKRMAEEVRKSGRVFQAGTQRMSSSAWRQGRKLIDEGLIGKPVHAECEFFRVGDWGEFGMPIDDANAAPGPDLDWEAFLGDAPKRPFDVSRYFRWRMYEDYAGGPVTDLYPHFLPQTLLLAGVGLPKSVVAAGGIYRYKGRREVPDTFDMIVQYPDDVTVVMKGSQASDFNLIGSMPVIRGTEGTLTFNDYKEIVFTPVHTEKDKAVRTFPIEHGVNEADFWQRFLACCRAGNAATEAPLDLSYHTQVACQMAYLAYENETVVKFDATTESVML